MATNENDIGVKAVFDIATFAANQQQYNAILAKANAATQAFYQTQIALQAKAAQQEKQNSDAIVAAIEKQTEATKQAQKEQSSSLKDYINTVARTAAAVGIIIGTIVIAYKKLEEEAKRLGDKDAIDAFAKLDTSVTNLGDSLAAMLLQAQPVADFIKTMAEGITALNQILIIVIAKEVGYLTMLFGAFDIIKRRIAEMMQGKIFSGMDIGKEFSDLAARAKQAENESIISAVNAPANVAATAQAEKDAKARKEADDKAKKDKQDYYDKIRDLQIKSGEDILAAEKDLQTKSASAWASYMEKSAQIIADGVAKRRELLSTYQDAIRSAEAEYQKASEDASYQHGQKLADIARTYNDAVRRINEDYQTESLDAARNLDAIGFIRAKEKRDRGLADAAQTRDESNASENENYQRQLFELQRSLEDKKREAELAYQKGLDDQRQAETEAQNQAKAAYNKELADAQGAFAARLAATQTAYTNEYNAAAAHYLGMEQQYAAHLAAMAALMAQYGIATSGSVTTGGTVGNVRRRASGGLDVVSSPTQFLAGEAGPEMVLTVPMNRNVPAPMTQTINHVGDFSHQIDSTIRSSVAGMDGRITAAVARALREVIGR